MIRTIFCFQLFCKKYSVYRNDPKFWDREALANSVDTDQTDLLKEKSNQGLHCLSFL